MNDDDLALGVHGNYVSEHVGIDVSELDDLLASEHVLRQQCLALAATSLSRHRVVGFHLLRRSR